MQVNRILSEYFDYKIKHLRSVLSFPSWCYGNISCLLITAFIILSFSGCIEEYNPKIAEYENALVIDGSVIREDSLQRIVVSRSTEVYAPTFIPVPSCYVSVLDKANNEFVFEEHEPGEYFAVIPPEFLTYENTFRLYVKTPYNKEYLSDEESILENSPVDSIYYQVEEYQSSSEIYEQGLQFYADLKAPDEATKNYRWIIEETWEINTFYNIDGFWKTQFIRVPRYNPISDSLNICWSSRTLHESYTASTENLVVNEKKKIPLNFISATSSKLDVKYSMLVKQYSLSEEAYNYHHQNNLSSAGDEGLFQKQPGQTRSNIYNINNPDESVLGYFWASSCTQKRIFFKGPLTSLQADCDYIVPCIPRQGQTLLQFFKGIGKDVYLVALSFSHSNPDSVTLWGYPFNQICIDCRAEGGTLDKPDFWE